MSCNVASVLNIFCVTSKRTIIVMKYTYYPYAVQSGQLSQYSDGLWAGLPGFYSRHGTIFLFSTASRPDLGPTQPPIQLVPGATSLRINWSGREADHSFPSSVEVKNGEAIPQLPHISSRHCAYKHRDNSTVYHYAIVYIYIYYLFDCNWGLARWQ
jgi:hypothetical protein